MSQGQDFLLQNPGPGAVAMQQAGLFMGPQRVSSGLQETTLSLNGWAVFSVLWVTKTTAKWPVLPPVPEIP